MRAKSGLVKFRELIPRSFSCLQPGQSEYNALLVYRSRKDDVTVQSGASPIDYPSILLLNVTC